MKLMNTWVATAMTGLIASALTSHPARAVERTIRYGFTLENETGRMVDEAHLWTYAPLERTANQTCSTLDVSHPYTLEEDAWGNRVLHFTFKNLPPFRQIQVRVEAHLELQADPDVMPGNLPLAEGRLFDLDDASYARLVPDFAGAGPADLAEQLYRWTAGYVRYGGYDARDRGAEYALRNRTGDCTEYMALLAALCRRHGLPVRGMAGYVYDRSTLVRPGDLHNWTEVYLDGRWWVADPLMRNFREKGDRYLAMYSMGSVGNAMNGYARFRFLGDGLKVTMTKR